MIDHGDVARRYSALPQELKDAIASINALPVIEEIAKEYKLHLDVTENLRREVVLVLFGEVSASEFPERVQEIVSLPREQVDAVVAKLDQGIFEKVRDALQKLTGIAEEPAATSEAEVEPSLETGPIGAAKLGQPVKARAETLEVAVSQAPAAPKAADPYHEPIE